MSTQMVVVAVATLAVSLVACDKEKKQSGTPSQQHCRKLKRKVDKLKGLKSKIIKFECSPVGARDEDKFGLMVAIHLPSSIKSDVKDFARSDYGRIMVTALGQDKTIKVHVRVYAELKDGVSRTIGHVRLDKRKDCPAGTCTSRTKWYPGLLRKLK